MTNGRRATRDAGLEVFVAQGLAGQRIGRVEQPIRRSGVEQAPARRTGARAEVNDPVRRPDDVGVVLDHDDGCPGAHQAVEHGQQPGQVVRMQAGRGFVEDQHLSRQRALAQIARQLDALRLAARQGGRGLAERQVAQADIAQRRQDVPGGLPVSLR